MKYLVNVTEKSYGFIGLEAENAEEAMTKATDEYHKGNVLFPSIEIDYSEPKLFERSGSDVQHS